ncbi:MAG: prephenate dehydrogenase/arogenate dehydrogenase family protein [Candidatus Gastranaerophilales bacterium]|nr:prephenate dehydrogenase/arogenate dehydrogenase family protein [Candidatus Gastranaerophilales bacterium]
MNIGIVCLGLIGGSILKSLSNGGNVLFAVTRNKETIKKARVYTENISDDISILSACDVIFVASPISKTIEILDLLEKIVSSECIVLDCASVKEFVMSKKRPYKFIGSHPMAGTELSGFDASFKELFQGAKWVLTPSDNIKENDIIIAKNIIMQTGAEIIIADAKEHDAAVALISHIPLIAAQALFYSASCNNLALKLASSGFRDMTRLAMSNLQMAIDMKDYNSKNIDIALKKLQNLLSFVNKTKDLNFLSDIKNARSKMYSSEGKNIF